MPSISADILARLPSGSAYIEWNRMSGGKEGVLEFMRPKNVYLAL